MAKLNPYDTIVLQRIEDGVFTAADAYAHAGPLAKLVGLGLVEMVRGVPVIAGAVNADGSSRLAPPKPPRTMALGQIQVRVPQPWIDELRQRGGGHYGPAVRDILGPALEGKSYRPGKYGPQVDSVAPPRRRRATA